MKFSLSKAIPVILFILFILARPACADGLKRDIFILGVHMESAQSLANSFRGVPTSTKPGAMDLIARSIRWSIEAAVRLKDPATELRDIEKRLNKLTFAQISDRLLALYRKYQTAFASIDPKAPGLFAMGVHISGAGGVAAGVTSFSLQQKPGNLKLIKRNLGWVQDDLKLLDLGLDTSLFDDLMRQIKGGASFSFINDRIAQIIEKWWRELEAQPAFGSSGDIFLSDMTAASESVGWGSMEKDIFAGEYPIKLGGVTYKKGLHTHAPAKITYSLNGRYSRFESYVGLWDSGNPKRGKKNDPAGTKGSIVVQVFLDGVKKYDSGLLGWRDTRHIQLSVIGARTMDLVVTDGGDGAGWDWAVWGNPKLYK